jgi:predicted glutamine amidotransferase
MCGIIGALNKGTTGFGANETKAFSDLMFMNTLRGMDSSGVILVDQEGNVDVAKDVMAGTWFTGIDEYDKIVEKKAYKEGKFLVGHNRKATIGKINIDNAHPFVVKDELILVHNGSLTSHKNLADKESDSHSIAIHLHENYKEDLGPTFAEIFGAYALVWYDVRTNKANIIRNSQRPLWMCETSLSWWFASEPYMLWAALERNNQKAIEKSMKQLDPNVLYSMDLTKMFYNTKWEETKVPFVQPVTTTKIQYPAQVAGTNKLTRIGGGKTSTNMAIGEIDTLSKNKFKDAYKRFLGQALHVNCEDFVDIADKGQSYYFYGTSLDVDIPHYIVGECSEVTAVSIMDSANTCNAMVVNAWYDKAEKKAVLKVVPSTNLQGKSNASQTALH